MHQITELGQEPGQTHITWPVFTIDQISEEFVTYFKRKDQKRDRLNDARSTDIHLSIWFTVRYLQMTTSNRHHRIIEQPSAAVSRMEIVTWHWSHDQHDTTYCTFTQTSWATNYHDCYRHYMNSPAVSFSTQNWPLWLLKLWADALMTNQSGHKRGIKVSLWQPATSLNVSNACLLNIKTDSYYAIMSGV